MKMMITKYELDWATGDVLMPSDSLILRVDKVNDTGYAWVMADPTRELTQASIVGTNWWDTELSKPSAQEKLVGVTREIDLSSMEVTIPLIGIPWGVQENDGRACLFHNTNGPIANYVFIIYREGDESTIDQEKLTYLGHALDRYIFFIRETQSPLV